MSASLNAHRCLSQGIDVITMSRLVILSFLCCIRTCTSFDLVLLVRRTVWVGTVIELFDRVQGHA